MRVRKLDSGGDMVFGQGGTNYLVNSTAAVAQAVQTALLLFQGEWFLDNTVGVPWLTKVVGTNTAGTYDEVIKSAMLGVVGVKSIVSYSSTLEKRNLRADVTLNTTFGVITFSVLTGYGIGGFGSRGFGL